MFPPKECPFCGSLDLVERADEDMDGSLLNAICCEVCDAAGPLVAGEADRAWAAWNLRTYWEQAWLGSVQRGTSHPLSEDPWLKDRAKACPFCGHRKLKGDDIEGGPSSIGCITCEASAVAKYSDGEEAIRVWNTRHS
jgi:Lar family restriction alleviation protein